LTYIANWIEVKGQESKTDSSKPKILSKDFAPPHDRYGPYQLQAWARRYGLEIDYVDNCWLRVEVSDAELRQFLEDLYPAEHPFVSEIVTRLSADTHYIIVAEEF
jgi:hypothetical protein